MNRLSSNILNKAHPINNVRPDAYDDEQTIQSEAPDSFDPARDILSIGGYDLPPYDVPESGQSAPIETTSLPCDPSAHINRLRDKYTIDPSHPLY